MRQTSVTLNTARLQRRNVPSDFEIRMSARAQQRFGGTGLRATCISKPVPRPHLWSSVDVHLVLYRNNRETHLLFSKVLYRRPGSFSHGPHLGSLDAAVTPPAAQQRLNSNAKSWRKTTRSTAKTP